MKVEVKTLVEGIYTVSVFISPLLIAWGLWSFRQIKKNLVNNNDFNDYTSIVEKKFTDLVYKSDINDNKIESKTTLLDKEIELINKDIERMSSELDNKVDKMLLQLDSKIDAIIEKKFSPIKDLIHQNHIELLERINSITISNYKKY